MRTIVMGVLALILLVGAASPVRSQDGGSTLRFAVLGHVRGDLAGPNPKLGELLERVRALRPDLIVLTGDMIWGDVNRDPVDSALVEREWDTLDSALAVLGVPVLRTPGNHDINDRVTRDIYLARYGQPPQQVDAGPDRFIMLSSAWIPASDSGKHLYIRGKPLGDDQVAFLEESLGGTRTYRHAFVFMHHLLWWEPDDGDWWQTVHPILASGGVRAVFSGDYGPMKFSYMAREGVEYYQTSIEDSVSVAIQQQLPSSWRLSSQFDNFLLVTSDSTGVTVDVHTVAERSSGAFTPGRWRAINDGQRPEGISRQVWTVVGSTKRLTALAALLIVYTVVVAWLARVTMKRRPDPPPESL